MFSGPRQSFHADVFQETIEEVARRLTTSFQERMEAVWAEALATRTPAGSGRERDLASGPPSPVPKAANCMEDVWAASPPRLEKELPRCLPLHEPVHGTLPSRRLNGLSYAFDDSWARPPEPCEESPTRPPEGVPRPPTRPQAPPDLFGGPALLRRAAEPSFLFPPTVTAGKTRKSRETRLENRITRMTRMIPRVSCVTGKHGESVSHASGMRWSNYGGLVLEDSQPVGKERATHTRMKVFADAANLKEKVREALYRPEYNVTNLYHKTGCCQYIACNKLWEAITMAVIAFNIIWLAVDTEVNPADVFQNAAIGFQIVEHCLTSFFVIEGCLRFGAFEFKRNCLRDKEFVFDTCLCAMSVGDTWILNLLLYYFLGGGEAISGNLQALKFFRLVRVLRMARMMRLLRAFPELMVLIKGIVSAGRSVFFTLILLFLVIFLFGFVFRVLAKDTDLGDLFFKDLSDSMFSLLIYGIVPSAEFIVECNKESRYFFFVVITYIFVATYTVMNLLIGVIVQVVNVISEVENAENTVKDVKRRLLAVLPKVLEDTAGEMTRIDKHDLDKLLMHPDFAKAVDDLGVDVLGILDSMDFIFQDAEDLCWSSVDTIPFGGFMEAVLLLRGTNQATVKNVVDLRKYIMHCLSLHQQDMMDMLQNSLAKAANAALDDVPPEALKASTPLSRMTSSTERTTTPSLSKSVTTAAAHRASRRSLKLDEDEA